MILPFLAPGWSPVATDTTANFRAISAPGGKVCWASGSKGTFARTVDGRTWTTARVKGAEDAEFRSIVAFDRRSATMLAIGEGEASRVFRTDDGGVHWALTWTNADPRAFYDALAFWDKDHGIAFGDPVDGRFPLLRTDDGGRTWTRLVPEMPPTEPGEAAFAASGRALVLRGSSEAWICTGGGAARVFRSRDRGRTWTVAPTPVQPGAASAGLFGLLFWGVRDGLAVGGDYAADATPGALLRTRDGGRTWSLAFRPGGLREAALRTRDGLMLVGPSGTDVSKDGGETWTTVANPGALHTAANAGGTIWAAGAGGLIARWSD